MKTRTTTKTRAEQLRAKYESNQLLLVKELGLSTEDMFEIELSIGIKFLEEEFPRDTEYEAMYKEHAYSASFWKWWKFQWQKWEHDYVSFLKFHKVKPTMKDFLADFEQMVLDNMVYNSFINTYLKSYRNGRKIKLQKQLSQQGS